MMYSWFKTVIPIAAIFAFRMLGLFMLIPVFTIYAPQLTNATPMLIGFALGSYGLTQGLLQIPFGILSDRFGRKLLITIGLVLFVLGSLLGAVSESIYTLILARTLQGTGAIGSVLIALLADLTPDQQRTKGMAVVGLTIGLSFSLAMLISPMIANVYGLAGIFYVTAILAALGLILLHGIIPTPVVLPFKATKAAPFKTALLNPHLQRLNLGIFIQHAILTSTFFAVPLLLQMQLQRGNISQSWHFYLPILLISFICMLPFLIVAEKKRQMKNVLVGSVLATSICQFSLAYFTAEWSAFCGLMFVYFIAFNILEASLPSLVSRQASLKNKGTAMGIYSSSQFLGIFVGGGIAGIIYHFFGNSGIFMFNGLLALVWLAVVISMQPYVYLTTIILPLPYKKTSEWLPALQKLIGVEEVICEQKAIHILINKSIYRDGSAELLLSEP